MREHEIKIGDVEKTLDPSEITFRTNSDEPPILKLCGNDIFVKGKLAENDKEIVEAMRNFLEKSKQW